MAIVARLCAAPSPLARELCVAAVTRNPPPCVPPPIGQKLAKSCQGLTSSFRAAHNERMISYFYAFWVLIGCNLIAFGMSLYAHTRVKAIDNTLASLDWETLANLTGEVGAIKRSLQKTNNRINGMTAADPVQMLSDLPQLQAMPKQNGRLGG